MNEWYPISTQYVQPNSSDVIRNLRQYLKNPIGATLSLLPPPAAFVTDTADEDRTRIDGNDLHYKLGNITQDTRLVLQAAWTVDGSTETAQTILHFKVLDTEVDTDLLEWYWFPPIDVFVDDSGNFSGTIASGIDDNLNNPSGAEVTYSIASKSASITSASLDSDTLDLSISVNGLTASVFSASVTVKAVATVGGKSRTAQRQIDVRLIYAISEKGDTGIQGDTGVGEKGDTGVGKKGIKETKGIRAKKGIRESAGKETKEIQA